MSTQKSAHLYNATANDKNQGFKFHLVFGIGGKNIDFNNKVFFKLKKEARDFCLKNSIEAWNF